MERSNQGRFYPIRRKAMNEDDEPKHSIMRVILGDLVIAVMLLAVVVTVVLGLLEMAP